MPRIYAKKVRVNDPTYGELTFDSNEEYLYFQELMERKAKGEIGALTIHPKYELQPEFVDGNGLTRKAINYEADFEFMDRVSKRIRIVDVKGWIGQDNAFPIHWKMFDYLHPTTPLEVLKYSKGTGFVPYEQYKAIRKGAVMDARRKAREAKSEADALKRAEAKRAKDLARLRELLAKPNPTKAERERISALKEKHKDFIVS